MLLQIRLRCIARTVNIWYDHLVDFLLVKNLTVKKVFAPEHGFRGTADAGEVVKDGIDTKTGLPIISLYGNNKKPSHVSNFQELI